MENSPELKRPGDIEMPSKEVKKMLGGGLKESELEELESLVDRMGMGSEKKQSPVEVKPVEIEFDTVDTAGEIPTMFDTPFSPDAVRVTGKVDIGIEGNNDIEKAVEEGLDENVINDISTEDTVKIKREETQILGSKQKRNNNTEVDPDLADFFKKWAKRE